MTKELKKLMTRVAKGEITMQEASDYIAKPKKVAESGSKSLKTTSKKVNTKHQIKRKIKKEV